MNGGVKSVLLLLGGAVMGAAAALLLTPKTGEEVRGQIADIAGEAKKRAKEYCNQIKQEISSAAKGEEAEASEAPKA